MAMIGPYCGKGDNPWLFAGKRRDSSGLINFGRRYYNPEFGRWITCDPQGFTDGPNLYAYVNNNPLTHFDEYGLFDGYWDCTPEESAMYNPEAQYRGMANAATAVFIGARDFFFGSTHELGASIHSEFWGNPNDPNRITPISQRSWSNIGLLAGGAAIELSPAKFIGLGGRAVKWLGKGAMKIPAVNRAAQVAQRSFRHLGRGKQVAHNVIKNASKQSNFNAKITSIQQKYFGSSLKNEQKILNLKHGINEWLGEGSRMVRNKANDPIFMSGNNMRKVRFDFNNSHGDFPHIHLEQRFGNRWIDASSQHRIYPKR
jgi:RHS repeat-associated protein